jgi:hypothetical protein
MKKPIIKILVVDDDPRWRRDVIMDGSTRIFRIKGDSEKYELQFVPIEPKSVLEIACN